MKQKKTYTAPAILEEIELGGIVSVLQSSSKEPDTNFEKVETMGQDIGGTIGENDWSQTW